MSLTLFLILGLFPLVRLPCSASILGILPCCLVLRFVTLVVVSWKPAFFFFLKEGRARSSEKGK